ncbi:MAG: type II toxin-antitoxin system ParD family antitoxin [Pseudoxanthomonas sp.]
MATTSLSLGEHWENFIRNEVGSGRYGSASEVVRDALRTLEERKSAHVARLQALRNALDEGENSGPAVPFDFDEFLRAKNT